MFPRELDEKVGMRAKKGGKGMIKRNACPQTPRFWYTSLNIWRSVSFVGWQLVNIVAEKRIHQILKNFLFFPTLPSLSSPFFVLFSFSNFLNNSLINEGHLPSLKTSAPRVENALLEENLEKWRQVRFRNAIAMSLEINKRFDVEF